jgi:hypothetical protein
MPLPAAFAKGQLENDMKDLLTVTLIFALIYAVPFLIAAWATATFGLTGAVVSILVAIALKR